MLCAAAILAVSAYYHSSRESAALSARVAGDPRVEAAACAARGTVAEQVACRLDVMEAAAAVDRELQILRAQQDMAAWSLGLLLLGVASVIVTALGVLFVALTLRETRRATQAALLSVDAAKMNAEVSREVGEKQARACLSVESIELRSEGNFIYIDLSISNSGNSPSSSVDCIIQVNIKTKNDPWVRMIYPMEFPAIMSGSTNNEQIGVNHDNIKCIVESDEMITFVGTVCLYFEDVFSASERREAFTFDNAAASGNSILNWFKLKQRRFWRDEWAHSTCDRLAQHRRR